MSKPDIRFEIRGSVTRFVPITAVAERWMGENIERGEWGGDVLVVEPRDVGDILESALAAGLEIGQ